MAWGFTRNTQISSIAGAESMNETETGHLGRTRPKSDVQVPRQEISIVSNFVQTAGRGTAFD